MTRFFNKLHLLALFCVFIVLPISFSACGTRRCFPAGTLISTPKGPVPIERLRVGNKVYSWSHSRGKVEVGTVLKTYRYYMRLYRGISLESGRTLHATSEHPIFTPVRGVYSPFSSIGEGQYLKRIRLKVEDDKKVISTSLTKVTGKLGLHIGSVFNIEVSRNANYFAGGVLAHNKSRQSPGVLQTNLPNNMMFTDLQKGFPEQKDIILTSSNGSVSVDSISLTGDDKDRFELDITKNFPVLLEPSREGLKIKIKCLANKVGEFSATLSIRGSMPLDIDLSLTVK